MLRFFRVTFFARMIHVTIEMKNLQKKSVPKIITTGQAVELIGSIISDTEFCRDKNESSPS